MKNLPEAYQGLKNRIEASSALSVLFELTVARLAPLAICGRDETRKTPALGVKAIREPETPFDAKRAAEILVLGWIDALTRLFLRFGAVEGRHLDDAMLPTHVALDPLPAVLAGVGLEMAAAREALQDLRETVPGSQSLPDEIFGILAVLGWSKVPVPRTPKSAARVPSKLLHAEYTPLCVAVAKAGTLRYVLTGPHEDGRYAVTQLRSRIVTSETARLDEDAAVVREELVRVIDERELGRVRCRSSGSYPRSARALVAFERFLQGTGRTYGRLIYAA